MTVASNPSFLRSLINHETYPIDLLDDPRAEPQSIVSVRKSLVLDGGAVRRDFLSPLGLKCIFPVTADHVVRTNNPV